MKKTSITAGIASALVAAALVAGCTASNGSAGSSSTGTADSVADPSAAPAVEAGPALPEVQLSTDEWVQVTPGAPLPEVVLADAKAQINAEVAKLEAMNLPTHGSVPTEQRVYLKDSQVTAETLSEDLSSATGRTVFTVFGVYGSPDEIYSILWAVTPWSPAKLMATETKDEMAANITAWIAAQPDPSLYEVVIP